MIIYTFDQRPHAWRRLQQLAHEGEVDFVVGARVIRRIHELDREIDALCWRIGALRGEDILLAQDRNMALDQEPRALVVIGDDALAEDDPLAGFQLDLERHGPVLGSLRRSWRLVVNETLKK